MLLQSLLLIAPARFSALGELVSQPSDDPQMGPSVTRTRPAQAPTRPLWTAACLVALKAMRHTCTNCYLHFPSHPPSQVLRGQFSLLMLPCPGARAARTFGARQPRLWGGFMVLPRVPYCLSECVRECRAEILL
jgi:hypothetical protein